MKSRGHDRCPDPDAWIRGDVVCATTPYAREMIVRRGVWIKTRARCVDTLAEESFRDEKTEVAIHRPETDVREFLAHTPVDDVGRWVQLTRTDDVEDKTSRLR